MAYYTQQDWGLWADSELKRLRALIAAHNERMERECWQDKATLDCPKTLSMGASGPCSMCPRRNKIEVENKK